MVRGNPDCRQAARKRLKPTLHAVVEKVANPICDQRSAASRLSENSDSGRNINRDSLAASAQQYIERAITTVLRFGVVVRNDQFAQSRQRQPAR